MKATLILGGLGYAQKLCSVLGLLGYLARPLCKEFVLGVQWHTRAVSPKSQSTDSTKYPSCLLGALLKVFAMISDRLVLGKRVIKSPHAQRVPMLGHPDLELLCMAT